MPVANYKKSKNSRERHKGKEQRQKRREEEKATKRDMNIKPLFGKPHETHLGKLRYRVILIRTEMKRRHRRVANITGLMQSIEWEDSGAMIQGSITVQRAPSATGVKVKDGNKIRLQVMWGGKWREIWTMRVQVPQEDLGSHTATFTLADEMQIIQNNEGDFQYKKSKKGSHKHGWKCHQIAADVCRRWNVPRGRFAEGTKWIKDITETDTSPIEVIVQAYKEESEFTGHKFIFRWRHSKLQITKLRRQRLLYILRRQITSALVSRDRGEKFFTGLHCIGNIDAKGKKKKKVEMTVVNKKAARRYGRMVHTYKFEHTISSKQEMRKRAKRIIARQIRKRTLNTISLSHPGIPFIRRGDAIQIKLPNYGFVPKKRPVPPFDGGTYDIVYVTSIMHSIDSSGHNMDMEFGLTDPIAEMRGDIREARDKERRDQKRRDRGDSRRPKEHTQ